MEVGPGKESGSFKWGEVQEDLIEEGVFQPRPEGGDGAAQRENVPGRGSRQSTGSETEQRPQWLEHSE